MRQPLRGSRKTQAAIPASAILLEIAAKTLSSEGSVDFGLTDLTPALKPVNQKAASCSISGPLASAMSAYFSVNKCRFFSIF